MRWGRNSAARTAIPFFPIKGPARSGSTAAKGKPPAKGAVKAAPPPEAKPIPAKPSSQDDEDEDEENNGKGYGLTDTIIGPRCPECANELESEDSIICLHCGYNTRTRTRARTKKTYDTTGGDVFLWLLPGILCILGIILLLVFDIIYSLNSDTWYGDEWYSFLASQPIIVWLWVLSLFIFFFLGRFAIKRLIFNNTPPRGGTVNAEAVPPSPRGFVLLAWFIILGVIAFAVIRVRTSGAEREQRLGLLTLDLQVRYLVGTGHLLKEKATLYRQSRANLDRGSFAQRLRFVILAGELEGPAEATKQLEELRKLANTHQAELTEQDQHLADLLDRLYQKGPEALSEEQRADIREQLGWSGELALASGDEPNRAHLLAQARWTAVVALALSLGALLALGVGVFVIVALCVLLWSGRLRDEWPAASPGNGVYAETFALWMVYYVLGSLLVGRFHFGSATLLAGGITMLSSLCVLAWPWLRGLSWAQVGRDLGLHKGKLFVADALLGAGTYACTLPLLVALLLLQTGLWRLIQGTTTPADPLAPVSTPAHPVIEALIRGDPWIQFQVVFAAAFVAPLVEEVVFRGLLYRHLRDVTGFWGRPLSVVISALLSGLVFAVIHPQGLVAVPFLTLLALVFALVREWRGTLVPSMVAHGINNAVLTLALILLVA